MSTIKHTRGDVTLERTGVGKNAQWVFKVQNQTSQVQELIINNATCIADLKAVVGQVEHAAKVLGDEP